MTLMFICLIPLELQSATLAQLNSHLDQLCTMCFLFQTLSLTSYPLAN
ncbi:hypothetical protein LINPERHAP1_LOCUS20624 [Linum perenne]